MAAEAARPPGSGGEVGGGRPRALPPYSGHIDATLDESGRLDVGAVAVRTDVARRVGFGWRHHAANGGATPRYVLHLTFPDPSLASEPVRRTMIAGAWVAFFQECQQ